MKNLSFVWLSPTLTAIGKKFGIDAHYFAKNSAFITAGHIVSIARGIVTGYLVARLFEKEMYGQYQFILSIVGMMTLFGMPGLAHSVTRAWARGDAFSIAEIIKKQLRICLIGSFILLSCIPFLEQYGRAELWPLFLWSAILFPIAPIATVQFGGYTVGQARFDIALKATFIWSILMILATFAIILFFQSATLLLIANMSIPGLVYLYAGRSLHPAAEKKGENNTKNIVRYGWQLTLASIPSDLVWYLDKLLISHYFGLAQLATFSVALLIPEQAKVFVKQFFPIVFAKQAKGGDSPERRIKLMKAVGIGSIIFLIGIIVYILLAPWFIPLLFPQYDAGELVLLTSIAAVTILANPASLFAQYLEAQGMIREIRWSQWSSAAIFAVALVILIPFYGLIGAIVARGIFRFTYVGLSWWFVMRSPIRTIPVS